VTGVQTCALPISLGYLRTHSMMLDGSGEYSLNLAGAVTYGAAAPNPAGGHSITYTHHANVTFNPSLDTPPTTPLQRGLRQINLLGRRMITYGPAAGGGFPGLRILPWRAGHVSELALDNDAQMAITGPLTGCTVAVLRFTGGGYGFYHANVSGHGGVTPANIAAKRNMIANLAGARGVAVDREVYCERGANYTGMAFAFALRRGAGWELYVHDYEPDGPTNTALCGRV